MYCHVSKLCSPRQEFGVPKTGCDLEAFVPLVSVSGLKFNCGVLFLR